MVHRNTNSKGGKKYLVFFILGAAVVYLFTLSIDVVSEKTSTDEYCMSCHVHTQADAAWKLSSHVDNYSGVIVHCVDCHLPPVGKGYLAAKVKHGAKDIYSYLTKSPEEIDWDKMKEPEEAAHFTYNESCVACHSNLFPSTLSDDGGDAHLYYKQNRELLNCINCHISVGHFDKKLKHEHNLEFGSNDNSEKEVYVQSAKIDKFEDFTEKIPNTTVSFEMVAIKGGTFAMGSPVDESYSKKTEQPQTRVQVSPFWIARAEVSWDEFLAFYMQTATEGHTDDMTNKLDVDAITGPTAPWGAPDQGWGRGKRPAITMSFHAAEIYCEWLTKITGKKYRLPTEAEWEYACRGGTDTPYFFTGDPKDYSGKGWKRTFIDPETEVITDYAVYVVNSHFKTREPTELKPNPFGLLNMSGNVWEFCSDWYDAEAYKQYTGSAINPTGPVDGTEHVIRGGAFDSDAIELRSASRSHTRTTDWLVTDPQIPKSIWWYSDSKNVGFRVVCELNENAK